MSDPFDADAEIRRYNAERDAVLLAMDETRIREFYRRWTGNEVSTDPMTFWAAVHKARTGIRALPQQERRRSMLWLRERSLRSYDDGDL